MPIFSNYFGLPYEQAQLDFFDCNTDEDRALFVDPYAISQMSDFWSKSYQRHLESFFTELLYVLNTNDFDKQIKMTSHFGEPGDTFIGLSQGKPNGRGVGQIQAGQLLDAIRTSKAAKTGLLSDLSELSLYIEGIDRDKISDLTTNIIRDALYDYTIDQCHLHSIPTTNAACAPHWDIDKKAWVSQYRQRPIINNEPVLLLPKRILRHTVSFRGRTFYNNQVVDFLRAENIRQKSPLVHFVKSRKEYDVYKGKIKEKYPYSKNFVAEFIEANPRFYQDYKRNLRIQHGVNLIDICTPKGAVYKFNPKVFADTLSEQLKTIPTGKSAANDYHEFMLGALTFLFYPHLSHPSKEVPLHSGRKRVDILFDNTAESGFFKRIADQSDINSKVVCIECKNYSKDISNPEFDQLLGRLSPKRGKFGIIVCRNDDNKERTLARCKDALNDDHGYVIVLYDEDIIEMLEKFVDANILSHLEVMQRKYRNIIM